MRYHNKILSALREHALAYGWKEINFQPANLMISFFRDGVRMNVYYTTMTVGTCLDHPVQGRTQLFRKDLSIEDIERLFDNPRTHTAKGYYKKGEVA